ncbi:Anthocyanin regulatory Lc protein [Triticum urartu]|uniref:Anthocyanin regulatory Lc protein n=2 Tax=Triticum urartu TaxID=4572 RepID=M8B383_TRIUA|nr:Anthocyanin regulatory Lc protein [Triticum urartu]
MALSAAPAGQAPPPGKQLSYQLAAASSNVEGRVLQRRGKDEEDHKLEQLRELYESLLSGKADHRARRPAASLSPEDLGEAEWYTYSFRPGQGISMDDSINGGGGVRLEYDGTPGRTSFWELPFQACLESEAPSSSPSTNETRNREVEIVVFEDLDHNVAKGFISELGEVESMSDANINCITTEEVDEFYGLIEELDVCALEDNWVMERSFEFMSSLEMAPDMDAPRIDDNTITLSSSVNGSRPSCFTIWKRSSDWEGMDVRDPGESQKLLKKVVAGGGWTMRAQESNIKTHVLSERRRREKLNEMFLVLKSLVPSINKMDKASILAETITYLKELEQRVEELESSRPPSWHPKEAAGRGLHDVAGRKKIKQSTGCKRKAPESEREDDDGPSNVVNVTMMDKEVILEVQCRWKKLLMKRVFDAIKSLHLDIVSVHTSTPGGLLDLKIRATHQVAASSATVAPGMITEALQKAISNHWQN